MDKLFDKLTASFRKGIEEVYNRELQEEDYLNQKYYSSVRERVRAGLEDATAECEDILTLAVSMHRQESHGDDRGEEIKKATAALGAEEVKTAVETESSGWSNS